MDDLKELNMQLKLGGKELRREKQFDLQQKKPSKVSKASIETNWKSNGSVILASHFAVGSDEEISYRTRFKMRVGCFQICHFYFQSIVNNNAQP